MRAALSTGVSMFYRTEGAGPPLVLIPGTSLDHECWRFQVPAFVRQYRTIAIDPRGAGQSDAPVEGDAYSTAIMADDVAALLDVLGVDRAHVCGLSLGSAIAQQLAIRHPDRVASLLLHGTWARTDAWFRQAFAEPTLYLLKTGDLHALFKLGQALIMSPDYLDTRLPQSVADLVSRCVVKSPHPPTLHGFAGQLRADITHDAREDLHHVRVPTLVTVGELDANTPVRYGRDVHGLIPGSRFHLFEGRRASHCACWEMADEFNAVCLQFLDDHATAA